MTEILSLSTVVKRDTISIKSKKNPAGKLYEIANAADFGPFEYAILHERAAEVQPMLDKLNSGTRLTKKNEDRVLEILNKLILMIVPTLEPIVLRELTRQQKESILVAWSLNINQAAAEGNAPGPEKTTNRRQRRSTGRA